MASPTIRLAIVANARDAIRQINQTTRAVAKMDEAAKAAGLRKLAREAEEAARALKRMERAAATAALRKLARDEAKAAREAKKLKKELEAAALAAAKLNASMALAKGRQFEKDLRAMLSTLNGASRGITRMAASFGRISGKALGYGLMAFIATGIVAGTAQVASALTAGLLAAAPAVGVLPGFALAAASAFGVLKVATTGLADAMQAGLKSAAGGTAAELKAYNKKLSQLSPAARALTQAFVGLYPALIKARNALSGKLFAGAAVEIKALAGTYLPLLTKHGEAVATSLNGAARAVAAFVRESRTVAGVKKSLGFVAVAVNNLAAGIKPLAQGLLPLVTVSASFLPQMTSGFKAVADQFAAFMVNAEKTGALKSFIQGGLDALKALFGIIQNVGGILKSVFVDANTGAGSFFTVIGTVIKQVDDFLNSAEGMKAIGAVWGILRSVGTALGDALGKVLPQLGKALVAIAPAIGPVATAMSNFLIVLSPILPIIGKLAAVIGLQLAKALPILAPMLLAVGTAIADLLTAVAPVLPIFASIASVVGKALAGALEKLVPHIGPLVKALGAGLLKVVTALAPVLPKLAEIFGKIMDAVTPLIGPIADLVVSFIDGLMPAFDKLKPSIDKLLAALGPAMITVIGQMKPSITALTGSLVDLAPTFAQITDKVIEAIPGLLTMSGIFFKYVMPAINDMAFAIVPLIRIGTPLIKMFYFIGTSAVALAKSVASFVGRVFGIIGKLQAFLADIGTALVAGFVGGLSRAWHSVTDFFSQAVNLIPDTFLKVLNFGSPSKVMRNLGIGTVASLAGGIKSQIPTIAKVMGTVAKVVSTGVTTDATVKVKAAAVVTGAVAGAGAVAPTTPPIVINVNVATGVDPAEVGRKTVLAIEAWQKRSGRRFLAPTPVPA